jgi:trehalose 6-phosphate synthase
MRHDINVLTPPITDDLRLASSRVLLNPAADGRRVIVLANREPLSHEWDAEGRIETKVSTSGLVTASEPLVRESGGVWVAHGSGSADRAVVDRWDGVMIPAEDPAYRLRRVWLEPAEQAGYYYGFANDGLWPLCHRVHVRPEFRSADFDMYWTINARFAEAVCDEAQDDPAIVFVQDYHFALAPLMIRERLPFGTIAGFWHIPWPSVERFEICPWAAYLVEGMLGADLFGFQTPQDCAHFLDAAQSLLGAEVDRRRAIVTHEGRRTQVRAYPASVQCEPACLREAGSIERSGRAVRARHGLRERDRLVVGVDRLDYTKGIEEKILAFERLLEMYPQFVDSAVFVQVAQPSRQLLKPYQEVRERVVAAAARVNARFATASWRPIVLIEDAQPPAEVYRLYRAADVCYVGSLHDGMNLVAKEFVTARDDDHGVLVLSGFAGAAQELTDAVMINPYDVEGTANALASALEMHAIEQQHRMRRMRAHVRAWDARAWGARVLEDAERAGGGPEIRVPDARTSGTVPLSLG